MSNSLGRGVARFLLFIGKNPRSWQGGKKKLPEIGAEGDGLMYYGEVTHTTLNQVMESYQNLSIVSEFGEDSLQNNSHLHCRLWVRGNGS